ncbi:Bgt-2522 [Blumeria graminis f. sp. tritici]|uniref:Bgt-2522 n=1 Tax=Blumeria graminis f. sp. tritici TaxID=62690 RepID=A0A9X9MK93_BLUGR|nr:Bgt-2522 [Blumeria graminis f. sp. tritici]
MDPRTPSRSDQVFCRPMSGMIAQWFMKYKINAPLLEVIAETKKPDFSPIYLYTIATYQMLQFWFS